MHTHTCGWGACLCARSFISLVALLISSLAPSNGNSCRIMPIKFVLLKNSFAKKFHKSNKYRVALRQSLGDFRGGPPRRSRNWGQLICHTRGQGPSAGGGRTKIQLCLLGHQFLKAPSAAPSELWAGNSKGIKSIKREMRNECGPSIYRLPALESSSVCG